MSRRCRSTGSTRATSLEAVEAAFLAWREAHDGAEVARTRGVESAADDADVGRLLAAARTAVESLDTSSLAPEEFRAADRMAAVLRATVAPEVDPGDGAPPALRRATASLTAAYTEASTRLVVDDEPIERLGILARLAIEPDAAVRRRLFRALEPLWQAVDGDGDDGSPYRALIAQSASHWAAGGSPIDANAGALGVPDGELERWCRAILAAWRDAFVEPARRRGEPPIEPWDWWWAAGEAERRLASVLPVDRLAPIATRYLAALGADRSALGIELDVVPRPGRPPIPVAFTTFGARPQRLADGGWSSGAPTVFATYTAGGLGELTELVHELGHAIHIAAIRTRPAFADWPDSDALSEAFGEVPALDTAEPAWHAAWLTGAMTDPVPLRAAIHERYAGVALDAAWALLEIELHRDPSRMANEAWTAITGDWLGIAPHPEWSWWAIRGQLVEAPGYMANYAVAAVLAADLRAAIRAARGDWIAGDPGWYPWVAEHLFRFGLERPSGEVVHDVLGRPPATDALVEQIRRGGG